MAHEHLMVTLAYSSGETPFDDVKAHVQTSSITEGDHIAAIHVGDLTIQTGGPNAAQDLIEGLHRLAEKVQVAYEAGAAG